MEIRVQRVHDEDAIVHEFLLWFVQPRNGPVYRGTERTPEVP